MRPEKKQVELNEDEKAIFNILKKNSPIDLNHLKEKSGLSNKKWDRGIKGLTGHKLAKVLNTENGLLVELV